MVQFNKYLVCVVATLVCLTTKTNVHGFPVAQRHAQNLQGTTAESIYESEQLDESLSKISPGTQMTSPGPITTEDMGEEKRSNITPQNTTESLEKHFKDDRQQESTSPDFKYEQTSVDGSSTPSKEIRNTQPDARNTGHLAQKEEVGELTTKTTNSDPKLVEPLFTKIQEGLQDILIGQQNGYRKLMDTILGSSELRYVNKRSAKGTATKPVTSKDQVQIFHSMFWLAFAFTRELSSFPKAVSLTTGSTSHTQDTLGQHVTKTDESVDLTTAAQNNSNFSETTPVTIDTAVRTINCTEEDYGCNPGSIKNVEANVSTQAKKRSKIVLNYGLVPSDTLLEFLKNLEDLQKKVNSTLDMTCSKIPSNDLPSGAPSCRSYAEIQGSNMLPCNGSMRTTDIKEKASVSENLMTVVEAINDHYQLLQAVSELHDKKYSYKIQCDHIIPNSVDHIRCKQTTAVTDLKLLQTLGREILTDVGVNEAPRPSTLFCEVDMSIQQKFPLGPLWRVQHDLEQMYTIVESLF